MRKPKDIRNQRFHNLTALYPTGERDSRGYAVWHCRCDCGTEVDISYNRLCYTTQTSCGCLAKAHRSSLYSRQTRLADTSLDSLTSTRLPKNNTTGHRGVSFSRGKYVAKINFQKKPYYLGAYDHIEDAVKARKAAEALLFDGTADFYRQWKQKAESDPQWAEANPIRIEVRRTDGGDFSVTWYPALSTEGR